MSKRRKKKNGRPSKYRRAMARQALCLCRLGARDEELAEFFAVAVSTVELWRKEHADFAKACTEGKAAADNLVEQALFQRAVGATLPDTYFAVIDGQVIATATEKRYPPETTACIFWLKNRRPKEWRDKQDLAVSDPNGDPMGAGLAVEIARQIVRQRKKSIQ